ncbi:Puromycin-sensitive aminopeptidase [Halotydeus destructor]|nr:Puromycin-sensitive aminopeptidase [Halotydeus destructor]
MKLRWSFLCSILLATLSTCWCQAIKSKVDINSNHRRTKSLTDDDTCETDGADYRLPSSIVPLKYTITIIPDLEKFEFHGEQRIQLKLNRDSVSEIQLHQVDLDTDDVYAVVGDKRIKSTRRKRNEELETTTYMFDEPIVARTCELEMKFSGKLDDKLKGFYRSQYTLADGTVKYAAVTQFEPTDARRAIPCFDEPDLKATFDITVHVKKGLTALSNMPEIRRVTSPDDDTMDIVTYDTTPVMSTYLLALVIGHFDYVEGKTMSGIQTRVYTPAGKPTEQGRYALEVGLKSLDLLENYFNESYPLKKMDMVAIPDFSAGAMENWGLVTYRETALLVDEASTSLSQKQQVALTVAHELAHQWFGNLVTMKWWTDLWLNEGFATFMMYYCVHKIHPEWNTWDKFVLETYNHALGLDALSNSHPVQVAVNKP